MYPLKKKKNYDVYVFFFFLFCLPVPIIETMIQTSCPLSYHQSQGHKEINNSFLFL